MNNKEIYYDSEKKVGSIVCFVVDHNHRGKGIATALLNEACKNFENRGYDLIEAYPRTLVKNVAENYHGPLNMYLKEGFVVSKVVDNMSVVTKKVLIIFFVQ